MEKICKTHGLTDFFKRSDGGIRCKKCSIDAVSKRRRKLKKLAVEFLGGKCQRCGYDKSTRALTFHHKNPDEKSFGMSYKGLTRSWEKSKEELKKCELVCLNCHAEIHEEGV